MNKLLCHHNAQKRQGNRGRDTHKNAEPVTVIQNKRCFTLESCSGIVPANLNKRPGPGMGRWALLSLAFHAQPQFSSLHCTDNRGCDASTIGVTTH